MAETGEGGLGDIFRVSFVHSSVGEAVIGLDGLFVDVNPSLCALLGYEADELRGAPAGVLLGLDDTFGSDGADGGDTFIDRMARGEVRAFATTSRYQQRGGGWVWLAYDLSLATDAHGEPLCVLVSVWDVTRTRERLASYDLAYRELMADHVKLARRRADSQTRAERYDALFETLPDTLALVFGEDKRILTARGTFLNRGELIPERLIGRPAQEVFDARDAAPLERYLDAALAGRRTTLEVHARTFDTDILLDVVPVEHPGGPGEVLVLSRDIGAFKERERSLHEADARWRASFEQAPVAMAEVTPEVGIVSVNCAFVELTGRSAEQLVGTNLVDLVHPDDRETVSWRLAWAAEGPRLGQDAELRIVRDDGSLAWVSSRSAALVADGVGGDNLVVHWVDISAEKAADQALAAARAHFAALVEHSSDVITVLDAEMRLTYASPAFARVFGTDPADMIGRALTVLAHQEDVSKVQATLEAVAAHPSAVLTFEGRFLHEDGSWRNIEATVSNLMENPAVGGLVCNCRDVTDRVQLADWLAHQAAHDPLTGLANRTLLKDRMGQALARIKRSGSRCAVLFIDLDHFKAVNDSRGHSAGDQLLVAIADRIRTVMRPNDTVARYGGDEFVVLAEDIPDEESALALADRVLDAVVAPVVLFDDRVSVSASVGVAVSKGHSAEALLDEADAALYEAKRLGRNRSALASGND